MIRDSVARTFDVLIVGAGATGALVVLRMAERGLTVTVLEAGPRFSGHTALQNAEANAGKFMWSEPRNFVGSDFVIPKAGTGVGGGTLTWLGVAPRFHREDFRTLSTSHHSHSAQHHTHNFRRSRSGSMIATVASACPICGPRSLPVTPSPSRKSRAHEIRNRSFRLDGDVVRHWYCARAR